MSDVRAALVTAYRNNLDRYHRLLQTRLTEIERQYIQSRVSDYRCALKVVLGNESEPGLGQDDKTRGQE